MSPELIHQGHLNIISEKLKQGFVTERVIHKGRMDNNNIDLNHWKLIKSYMIDSKIIFCTCVV